MAQTVDTINKDSIAELFVGTEIVKYSPSDIRPQLYYGHKEKKGSNAEVDYVLQENTTIVPIEVKSGIRGKMQSMKIFLAERKLPTGIRISLENFSRKGDINVYPLYAVSNIVNK